MFNLPVGVGSALDDCDMICTHCDCRDDVDNGEYVNHAWYCEDCYKELFKKCPKCEVIISVDEELCEDCLSEKTYDESARGMFEKLGYPLNISIETFMSYGNGLNTISFSLDIKCYSAFHLIGGSFVPMDLNIEEHKAITQQMKELGWL